MTPCPAIRASAITAISQIRPRVRLCPVKACIPCPSSGTARSRGHHKLQIAHPHGAAFGDGQARVPEQGDHVVEFDMAVAAVDVIEKAVPVLGGLTKVDGEDPAARL